MPQTLFHYYAYPQKQIQFFWLRTIGDHSFRIFLTTEKDGFANFLAELREICKVILFWCHEISKRRVAVGTDTNKLNLF